MQYVVGCLVLFHLVFVLVIVMFVAGYYIYCVARFYTLFCLFSLLLLFFLFFFKQKTAYEMRISDWSSDVCSSDLASASDDAARGTGADEYRGIEKALSPSREKGRREDISLVSNQPSRGSVPSPSLLLVKGRGGRKEQ